MLQFIVLKHLHLYITILKKILKSGRQLIGFDLSEVGIGENGWDANVGARELFQLCNLIIASNQA